MTVSAGVGGGTVVGVVLGGGASGSGAGAGQLIGALPHTGASHIMMLLALAIFLLVAGVLMTGMGRHRAVLIPVSGAPGDDSSPI
ncbi:MAG: hypothetical protein JWM40_2300 [Frankiales bacterium]|nr:hypothetical protein [Frankiales bacterium]